MARIFPQELPVAHLALSPAETRILNSLRAHLSDEWTVFYAWRWAKHPQNRGRQAQGEMDFLLFHAHYGLIVIEAKSGTIAYQNGQWTQNGFPLDDPSQQAAQSKFDLIARLKAQGVRCMVSEAVWFTDVRWQNRPYPPSLNEHIVLDEQALAEPEFFLIKAFNYWNTAGNFRHQVLSPADHKRILDMMMPAFRLVPTLPSRLENNNQAFFRLSQEQLRIFDYLVHFPEVSVQGRAGTGKTVLALEKARLLAQEGKKVLLLCYNDELGAFLKRCVADLPGITAGPVYHFAGQYLETYHPAHLEGLDLENLAGGDWNRMMKAFLEETAQARPLYDAVLIDEGQDFEPAWLLALQALRKSPSQWFLFYDPYQHVMSRKAEIDTAHLVRPVDVWLPKNHRNTRQISRSSLNVIGQTYGQHHFSDIEGPEPEVLLIKTGEVAPLHQKINLLIQVHHLNPAHITVITLASAEKSMVKPERLPYGVAFKTVRKFKGLENEVVLVVDVQYEHLSSPEGQRLLYTATSRAKNVLAIFLTDPPPDARQQKFKTEWLVGVSFSENMSVQKGLETQLRKEQFS
ncbi:MAG: hypothetical protein OHK0053_15990 [Microscillaceae bacterium]